MRRLMVDDDMDVVSRTKITARLERCVMCISMDIVVDGGGWFEDVGVLKMGELNWYCREETIEGLLLVTSQVNDSAYCQSIE